MSTSRHAPPQHSRNKLAEGLKTFMSIKAKHKRWMNFLPSKSDQQKLLYPHAIFSVQLSSLLDGKPLSSTLKKAGWMYFLRDRRGKLACGEVSIVGGRHKNARVSEGPFVKKAFALIEKSIRDSRIFRRGYELRSLRLESMHLFCLWFKLDRRAEHFVPVTSGSKVLKAGKWFTRKEFTAALHSEVQRIRAAQERMAILLKQHQGVGSKDA
jgi:hypothetical protein